MTDVSTMFDVSTLTENEHKMTKEELVSELLPKIHAIVAQRFPGNPRRQVVKVYRDRISFCAPCCGDSAHSDFKRRGNIILEGRYRNRYKCHNCGTTMTLQKFLDTYGQKLSLNAIDYVMSNTEDIKYGSDSSIGCDLMDMDEVNRYAVPREEFKSLFGLMECNVPSMAHDYLVARNQYDFRHFLYEPTHGILFVLNVTPDNNIFGVQTHHFDKKYKGPKYKTYSISKIHKEFLRDDVEVPDDINDMSMIFNILLVDYNKYVTVLEGPMDSFLVKNSVALCGAGKHMEFIFAVRYMFDDDETGRKHAIEKLENGEYVFMWDAFKKSVGLPRKSKWDMNDVVNWGRANNVTIPPVEKFFSNDEFDIMNI